MREEKQLQKNTDWTTIFIYITLVLMGWFNIYSAVYNEEHSLIYDVSQRYGKQMIFILAAFFIALVVMLLDVRFFTHFAYPIYGISILLLIAVLLVGVAISGSRSWFQFGGFSFQPSELAKFATCLALARYLGSPYTNIKKISVKIMALVIAFLPPLVIMLQPDAGSAMVFVSFILVLYREGFSGWILVIGLILVVLFVLALLLNMYILYGIITAGVLFLVLTQKKSWKNVLSAFLLWALAIGFTFTTDYAFQRLKPHQKDRINVLLGKEVDLKGIGYNVNQSKIAIGSGGFIGKGYLNGTQTKYNFVPEQGTDFIFCTVGEEWGLVGSSIVLGLFLFLCIRLINMAERQRSVYARVYGYGVACIIFFHVFVNVGMAIGLLPVIGIPLPFFSYGGSSLWSFTLLLFVFLKMDANRIKL